MSLFTDDMTAYVKNPKEKNQWQQHRNRYKPHGTINCSKVAGYRASIWNHIINTNVQTPFPYITNEQLVCEMKKSSIAYISTTKLNTYVEG